MTRRTAHLQLIISYSRARNKSFNGTIPSALKDLIYLEVLILGDDEIVGTLVSNVLYKKRT